MKTIEKKDVRIVFQGDIMLTRADKLPQGYQKADTDIVAHSETGHHHVAQGAEVLMTPESGMTIFMRAMGDHVDLVHKRPYDTHETIRLYGEPGQLWKIQRQREYTPEGWRQVAD